jgi:hypothetical protein
MSRRLGALALTLGLLVCSMSLKAALSSGHPHGSVTLLNGPDPVPPPGHIKWQANGPDPVPPPHILAPVLLANGPDQVPRPQKPGPKSGS